MPSTPAIEPPELRAEDVLTVDDDRFTPERVAIVTGGGSGIGRATTVALAVNGLTVVAADVDREGLDGTIDVANDLGVAASIHPVEADLAVDDDVERIVEEATSAGSLTYLANVAGLQHVAPIEEFPMAQYDRMHAVMLRAPLLLAKHSLPHIRATPDGEGGVGNMCSIHGHYVTRDKVAYNVAKFGLRGLTQSIAAEGDGKIRSFSVSTTYVKTPLVLGQIEATATARGISEREVVEDVMLGEARVPELMDPIEVANLFTFGFSRHGRHLNGGDLRWDGGYTLTY